MLDVGEPVTKWECYSCGAAFATPDFYILVTDDEGNQFLLEDLSERQIQDTDTQTEVERCPRCGAEL